MRTPPVNGGETTPGKRRGFYLIPSLFTVANIFCGFLSIVASSRGQFERASILILIAIFADILDGRIARLTGTVTQFGEEFDSLADVTSFGVAPALLAFQWGLWEVPRVGMAVAFSSWSRVRYGWRDSRPLIAIPSISSGCRSRPGPAPSRCWF